MMKIPFLKAEQILHAINAGKYSDFNYALFTEDILEFYKLNTPAGRAIISRLIGITQDKSETFEQIIKIVFYRFKEYMDVFKELNFDFGRYECIGTVYNTNIYKKLS